MAKYEVAAESKRSRTARLSGTAYFGSNTSQSPLTWDKQVLVEQERKVSSWTPFPVWRRLLRDHPDLVRKSEGLAHHISHSDFGANFFHERITRRASRSGLAAQGTFKSLGQGFYSIQKGPIALGVWNDPIVYTSDNDIENTQAILFGLGGTAISRVRPNKPFLDLSVTVGELRKEGLPSMIGSLYSRSYTLKEIFRSSGKEYLNYQFGWAPLIRDLAALTKMISQSRKALEQHERDISRLVRRRYHFPPSVSTTLQESTLPISQDARYWFLSDTPLGYNNNVNVRTWISDNQKAYTHTKLETQTWFSGAFRFYEKSVPEALERLMEFENQANLLMGTRLDPEVLWNLQPWSWMADWFINFGDILGNVSAIVADQLVVQHGYIMRTETATTEVTTGGINSRTGNFGTQWFSSLNPISNTLTAVRHHRGRAYPFGFGLNPDDFSASQWAILGALGMSVSPRK